MAINNPTEHHKAKYDTEPLFVRLVKSVEGCTDAHLGTSLEDLNHEDAIATINGQICHFDMKQLSEKNRWRSTYSISDHLKCKAEMNPEVFKHHFIAFRLCHNGQETDDFLCVRTSDAISKCEPRTKNGQKFWIVDVNICKQLFKTTVVYCDSFKTKQVTNFQDLV